MGFLLLLLGFFAGVANCQLWQDSVVHKLDNHDVFQDYITLSGFSSGGTFAQQLQFSYSSLFSGIASISHAYYRCGPGNGTEEGYDNACTIVGANPVGYDSDLALEDIRRYEREGLIESTENLRNKKLFLYAGSRSSTFDMDQGLGAIKIYEPFIRNTCAIKTVVQDAEELLPTANFGAPCRVSAAASFFLGNCGYFGAYEALSFLLGDFIRYPPPNFRANARNLLAFDQTEFFYGMEGNQDHLMDTVGYVYVPKNCQKRRCYLHFYFHGCRTGREFNGTSHLVNSGYLEVADVNDLIVVAPQVRGNEINTGGCWDTYGLTGSNYATQRGAQVVVVRNILARIMGNENEIPKKKPCIKTTRVVDNRSESTSNQ